MKYYVLFFIAVKSFSIPDASEGVFYDRWLEIYFDEKVDLESVTKDTVRVTDSKGRDVPGRAGLSPVHGRVLAPSRTMLTFLPRHGWPAAETITVEVAGLRDDAGNVMDRVYRTTFATYTPRVLAQAKDDKTKKPLEGVRDLDYFPNTVIAVAKTKDDLDGIATVDVTDPENPKLHARINLPGHPAAVRTFRVPGDTPLKNRNGENVGSGDFALVSSGYLGTECYAYLSLIRLSDPRNPYSLGDMRIAKNASACPYPDEGFVGRVYEAPGWS